MEYGTSLQNMIECFSYSVQVTSHQCLGDLSTESILFSHFTLSPQFTQTALVDAYSNFIQHFVRVKAALTKHTSPALAKALEVSCYGD